MQRFLSARPANLGIMIRCPHCSFGSRYDVSYLEDAIKFGESLCCLACNKSFVIKAHRQKRSAEQRDEADAQGRIPLPPDQTGYGLPAPCPRCGRASKSGIHENWCTNLTDAGNPPDPIK